MKVTSSKTVEFPSIGWGIHPGEERELPEDKAAQEAILAHPAIAQISGTKSSGSSKKEKDEEEPEVDTSEPADAGAEL